MNPDSISVQHQSPPRAEKVDVVKDAISDHNDYQSQASLPELRQSKSKVVEAKTKPNNRRSIK